MMSSNPINPLVPTYQGFVNSTFDALLLFEACLAGHLNHVPRRPHDRERQDLIRSGNVFIYEEHASGIKRWTDGISWSPSRILGNYLIYRELDEPFPPGEKKRALKKSKHSSGGINRPDTATRTVVNLPPTGVRVSAHEERDALSKILIGSLVDSYNFKAGGLIKKTISVQVNSVPHHLVSYYSVDDILNNGFPRPAHDPFFERFLPRHELLHKQNFRATMEEFSYPSQFPYHNQLIGDGQLHQNRLNPSANHSGYVAAYSGSAGNVSQSPVPHPQPTAPYGGATMPGYLMNGMHSQHMSSPLHLHAPQQAQAQAQVQVQAHQQAQPQQHSISPRQHMPPHQQMQQFPWSPYPSGAPNTLPGFYGATPQIPVANGGYFNAEVEDSDEIKEEQLENVSWVIPNESDTSSWSNNNDGDQNSGNHQNQQWNGQS
jgi:hypothetical protein